MPLTWTSQDLQDFLKRNDLTSPADINPLDQAHMASLDWGVEDPQQAQQAALAHRRVFNLTGDLHKGEQLLANGFHSACQIASMAAHRFVNDFAEKLGLSHDQAHALHQKATAIHSKTQNLLAAVHGAVAQPHFNNTLVGFSGTEATQHFESLPSYQDMFGSLNYCACETCMSIFGPAAYLVDLLRVIDEYVTQPNSDLAFSTRRQDIAQIPLTCAMTNDLVPYLQIVDERLMDQAVKLLNTGTAEALLQKAATGLCYPLNLPFNMPLDEIRVQLQQLGVSLGDIYADWGVDSADVVREKLGLTPTQYQTVVTPQTDAEDIAPYYNNQTDLSNVGSFTQVTGLTQADAQNLIVQGLTAHELTNGVAQNLFINQGLGTSTLTWSVDGQGNVTIPQLGGTPNVTALDSLNRLRRLARALNWTPSVTDWLLRAVNGGQNPTIAPSTLPNLVRVTKLVDAFDLTPMQAATLFGPIKTYGDDGQGGPAPFDQLFNPPALVAQYGKYHPTGNPLNPGYNQATKSPTAAEPLPPQHTPLPLTPAGLLRVAPGLGATIPELNQLASQLFGSDLPALTVDTLSILYRHCLIRRCFNLTMDAYLVLLDLVARITKTPLTVFAGRDLDLLLDAHQWMTGAGLNPYQLSYVVTGTRSVWVDPLLNDDQIEPWLTATQKAIALSDPQAEDKLVQQVAAFFKIDSTLASAVWTLCSALLPAPTGCASWTAAFLTLAPQNEATDLVGTFMGGLARWLVFVQAANIPADVLNGIQHPITVFGLDPLSVQSLQRMQQLAGMIQQFGDLRGDLVQFLNQNDLSALSDATGWSASEVTTLTPLFPKGGNPVHFLERLARCFGQMQTLGADVSTMQSLAALATTPDSQWQSYTQALSAVTALCHQQTSPSQGQHGAHQLVHTRDMLLGLVQTALNSQYADIQTPNNVYEYLLCDVKAGPELQISYIKEALNAAQLYLQRCRIGLESGVTVAVPEVWWEWLMDYRVWQANREIFVYPENYLIPSVRKTRTHAFKKLESALLQSEVTPAYAESAYKAYVEDLLATLEMEVVDAYYGPSTDDAGGMAVNTLYLFARTRTSPYSYHYCERPDGGTWSDWKKIDLTINASQISAVRAFNKLFVFWVKYEKVNSSTVGSDSSTGGVSTNINDSYQATIHYSYLDRSGKWITPQTLAQDVTVLFDGQGADAVTLNLPNQAQPGTTSVPLMDDPAFSEVFDMTQDLWQKVFLLRVSEQNYAPGLNTELDCERLVVLYGPSMANTDHHIDLDALNPPSRAAKGFAQNLTAAAENHNRLIDANYAGEWPFCSAWVLDRALQANVLAHKKEVVLLDPVWTQSQTITYQIGVNTVDGFLQVAYCKSPLTHNYSAFADFEGRGTQNQTVTKTSFQSALVSPYRNHDIINQLQPVVLTPAGNDTWTINQSVLGDVSIAGLLNGAMAHGDAEVIQNAVTQWFNPPPPAEAPSSITQQQFIQILNGLYAQNQISLMPSWYPFVWYLLTGAGGSAIFSPITPGSDQYQCNIGWLDGPEYTNDIQTLMGQPGQFRETQLADIQHTFWSLVGAPALLGSVSPNRAAARPVSGQPGNYLFFNGDETFLVKPDAAGAFLTLDAGAIVSPPPVLPACPGSPSDPPLIAPPDFMTLVNQNYIDLSGFVNLEKATFAAITNAIPSPVTPLTSDELARIVLNYPLIYDYAFVSDQIDLFTSQSIFQALTGQQPSLPGGLKALVDQNRRLCLDRLNLNDLTAILTNPVTLTATSFATDSNGVISEDLSQQVFNFLRNQDIGNPPAPIISPNGTVNPIFAPSDLSCLNGWQYNPRDGGQETITAEQIAIVQSVLLNALPFSRKQILSIYKTLVETPVPVAIRYANTNNGTDYVQNGQFQMIRLSTGAVPRLERALMAGGVAQLLSLETQGVPVQPVLPFSRLSPDGSRIIAPQLADGGQIDFKGVLGQYFWELFYHGPMLVATSLAANQQFREAIKWFHYIFNPTPTPLAALTFYDRTNGAISQTLSPLILTALQDNNIGTPPAPIVSPDGWLNPAFNAQTSLSFLTQGATAAITPDQIQMVTNVLSTYAVATPASRFWQFFPFRTHTLQTLQEMLTDANEIGAYNNDPFDPFAIARLRIGAFEKATLMQYVDTLIQWGDYSFAQDTWESITAATMLYVYAADLLGPRPQQVAPCETANPLTYADIQTKYTSGNPPAIDIPEFLIYLESTVPPSPTGGTVGPGFNNLGYYFGIPENQQLLSYWDLVEDRLHKIRHGENIQGIAQQLPLFQPPINPMDLVRAAAGNNGVLPPGSSVTPPPPPQRFAKVLQLAHSLTDTVIQLGDDLLSALEKQDTEKLAILRNTQAGQILALNTQVRQQGISELQSQISGLESSLSGAQFRQTFYTNLIASGLSSFEQSNLTASEAALVFNIVSSVLMAASAIGYAVPQAGSPFAMTYGGQQLGAVIQAAAGAVQIGGEVSSYEAQRALTMAGYGRRSQDWQLQQNQAQADVNGLTNQLTALQAQLAAALQELSINQKRISQNQAIGQYLQSKFSDADLYLWMVGRLSDVYFQTFQLALSIAQQAQVAYQFELNATDTFLDFDYWDSLKKGLMAGQGLRLALNRMEVAYAAKDTRKLEIERTISLAQLHPQQLDLLRTTGTCSFDLPEILFDYDYPGHYARQIKCVSLSIPAVVGPYDNIRATLTQTKNQVALTNDSAAVQYLINPAQGNESNIRSQWGNNQAIAVSRGVDDSGLFVLDFQDERYLPFEGTGVVSSWTLDMPRESNRFDFNQLSDVIVNVSYTACFDGDLQQAVKQILSMTALPVGYYVDVRQQDPIAWQAFIQNHATSGTQTLQFKLKRNWLGKLTSMTLSQGTVRLRVATDASGHPIATVSGSAASLTIGSQGAQTLSFTNNEASLSGLPIAMGPDDEWQLAFTLSVLPSTLLSGGWVDPTKLLDVVVMVNGEALTFGTD